MFKVACTADLGLWLRAGSSGRQGVDEILAVMMEHARIDPAAARTVLGWFATCCTTIADFERERAYVWSLGIPAAFLRGHPFLFGHHSLGRGLR
jgi:hypothetical protein